MSPQVQRVPPYQQIADHYRTQILAGDLTDGAHLPGSRELADQWRTTQNTAARALNRLQAEGLVRVLPRGAVVTAGEATRYTPQDRAQSVAKRGKIYPPSERAQIVAADLVQAPSYVAAALGVDPRTPVVRRSRVTYHGDLPVTLSVSWLSAKLATAAPALLDTARIPGGTIGLIHELTGRSVVSGHDQICARGATAEVAKGLGVGEGAPVLYGTNWWSDDQGSIVEFGEFWIPADRKLTYRYEIS